MTQEDVRGAAGERYTRVAIWLHWAIAAFIIFNLLSGLFTDVLPPPLQIAVLTLHVSSGLTVLALTLARIAWRLMNDPPPFPMDTKPAPVLYQPVSAGLWHGKVWMVKKKNPI